MEIFSTYCFSNNASDELSKFLTTKFISSPVLLCIGTDKMLADCLGSVVATTMRNCNYPNYIYGGLDVPITQQNAQFCQDFIHTMHPSQPLIIIDSMTTSRQSRLGHITITNNYIGAINSLKLRADLFIYGISSLLRNNTLCSARLNNILAINSVICNGLKKFIKNIEKIPQKYTDENSTTVKLFSKS